MDLGGVLPFRFRFEIPVQPLGGRVELLGVVGELAGQEENLRQLRDVRVQGDHGREGLFGAGVVVLLE